MNDFSDLRKKGKKPVKLEQPRISKEEVKRVRTKAGLTMAEAGALIGKGERAWQTWEYGEREVDSLHFHVFLLRSGMIGEETENGESIWNGRFAFMRDMRDTSHLRKLVAQMYDF